MKKYFFRLFIGSFVFLFFKITRAADISGALEWYLATTIYMVYTVVVVMLLWEVIARSATYFDKKVQSTKDEFNVSKLFLKVTLVSIPCVLLFAYLFNFHVIRWVPEDCCMEQANFWADAATGYVMGLLIIYYEIVKISNCRAVKTAKEKESIQKELFAAKYEGLKNQVNPHFLFNSFSTLTSLVETDSKAAVDFIDKLSDLYRYVLEHDGQNLVSLKCELNFLDDYVYLLQIRHQDSLIVKKDINLKIEDYKVPSLSIQTLVENAIKHNSFSKEDPLEILITNDENGFISVKNLKSAKPTADKTTKIGLKNLANRIKLTIKKELQILEDESSFEVKLPISLAKV